MYWNIFFVVLAALPASLAHITTVTHLRTSTKVWCETKYSSKPVHPVWTGTVTTTEHAKPYYTTITTHPTSWKLEKPYSSTKIVKTTIVIVHTGASQGTRTVTTTKHTTLTNTHRSEYTVTTPITTTLVAYYTVHIPAPVGFTPISDSAELAPPSKRTEVSSEPKREIEKRNYKKYAECVDCTKELIAHTTFSVVHVGSTVVKMKTRPTVVVTSTHKVTSTYTIPKASVTTTKHKTSTATIDTTIITGTTTATVTVTAYSTTVKSVYDACATSNEIGPMYKNPTAGINGGQGDSGYTGQAFPITQIPTAEDCCAKCFQTPLCMGSFFATTSKDAGCTILITGSGSCANPAANVGFVEYDTTLANGNYIVGNGPCGVFVGRSVVPP